MIEDPRLYAIARRVTDEVLGEGTYDKINPSKKRMADLGDAMDESSHDHPRAGDEEYRGFRITSLWAYTVIDDDDQEGIPALRTPEGPLPLIASDRVRLDDLRGYAQELANGLGKEVRLRRFVANTELHDEELGGVEFVLKPQ